MIRIYYTDAGGELRVDLDGHGNMANFEALDVMCAATTTLTNTLAFAVIGAEEQEMLDEKPTVYVGEDGEGRARILCKPVPKHYAVVKAMFVTVINGYRILSTLYPDYVQLFTE